MAQSASRGTLLLPPPWLQGRRFRRINWPLLIGYGVVALVIFIAVFGPVIATRSPAERAPVIKIGDRFYGPPFPPFLTWDYPLGSDGVGRDLLSQLLWGVRPTMIMVLIVAATRLVLGLIIGLAAGWSRQGVGRLLSALIDVALAIPILIVALAAIAVVGIERGLLAFIVGLALTGWAETARLVAEQTRLLRDQPYIQAARALGASGFHILLRHMLRHMLPLAGMLFAFDISATLMVVAALGFLGYYIGGGVLVQLDDNVTGRFIELPELGQMLATALFRLNQPGPMIIIGTTIFVVILGFNMLGEGLRHQLQHSQGLGWLGRLFGRFFGSIEERVLVATGQWGRRATITSLSTTFLLLLLLGGVAWWQNRPTSPTTLPASVVRAPDALILPGGHLWSGGRGGPAGTRHVADPQLGTAPTVVWTFAATSGFVGSPAVAADGTIYAVSEDGTLYALDPVGQQRWQTTLPAPPIGTPALGLVGEIFVVSSDGTLTAIAPDGTLLWRFRSQAGREATSGPTVAADGTIYYTLVDRVQAVSSAGTSLWVSSPVDDYIDVPPLISPTGDYLFLRGFVLRRSDGAQITLNLLQGDQARFVQILYFIGVDGTIYYRAGSAISALQMTAEGLVPDQPRDLVGIPPFFQPNEFGVNRDGTYWTMIAEEFGPSQVFWHNAQGELINSLIALPRNGQMIAIDTANTIYLCGGRSGATSTCVAATPTAPEPVWTVELGRDIVVRGGALVPERLYVTAENGTLYAIGAGQATP